MAHTLDVCVLVDAHPQGGVAGNDFSNGFNEISRASIFEGLYHSPFASLIPAACRWYGERGALILEHKQTWAAPCRW